MLIFESSDPGGPICDCGELCDGTYGIDRDPMGNRVGWCVVCEDWAVKLPGMPGMPMWQWDPGHEEFKEVEV